MKLNSLRGRVIAWYVGMLALALVGFGVAIYFGIEAYLETSLEHSLSSQADGIASNFLTEASAKGLTWLVDEVTESYAPEISGRFIRITRRDGDVLYESGDSREPFIAADKVLHAPLNQRASSFRKESLDGQHPVLIYTLPYSAPDGTGYLVEVGASRLPIEHILGSLFFTLLLLTPTILFIAAVGGYLLMKQPLKPIVALTQQSERIGAENFRERLPVIPTGDELERLSLSLNRMLARLEDAITHIQRFSGDVSHELRTPLTILRGELEQAAQSEGLDGAMADAIGSALEEIERLTRIVESLLAIAHLDYGSAGIEKTCVDLRALACDTAEQMRILAEDKGLTVECQPGDPVEVLGDEARLRQLVVNLLDNAIKYTQVGGRIEMRISSVQRCGTFEIRDNGIGIPAEALPHIFERFYRADKARSRASGGAGLGLSIVKAICSAHGGEVFAKSVEGNGTTLTVELPLISTARRAEMEQAEERGRDAGSSEAKQRGPELNRTSLQDEESPVVVPTATSQR
jgi:heavy metal sensor kinase